MVWRLTKDINLPKFWPSGRFRSLSIENKFLSQSIASLSQNNITKYCSKWDEKDLSRQHTTLEMILTNFAECRGAPLDITALKPGEVYELHRYLKSKVCCFIFFAKLIFCVILLIGFLSSVHFKRGVWQKLLQSFDFMLLSNPLHQMNLRCF